MRHVPRLYLASDLHKDIAVPISSEQAHYLGKVMRLGEGDELRVFNGKHGEWRAKVLNLSRKEGQILPWQQSRVQQNEPIILLAFTPIKRARTEFIIEKATEMGVAGLQPVRSRFTNQKLPNPQRLQAIMLEAAEQSERLDLPQLLPELSLASWLEKVKPTQRLVFCDEGLAGQQTEDQWVMPWAKDTKASSVCVLIGPEGGFSSEEREQIAVRPGVIRIGLGPRILRSDTAAIAALAIVQDKWGDW